METGGGVGLPGSLITPDGRRISWSEAGQGSVALLFIHGWCGDSRGWRHQMAAFASQYRCVALDLAGHGGSSPAAGEDLSVETLARDVQAVRKALSLGPVVLVGHSLGGPVAIESAIAAPAGIAGIVGVDTFTDERVYVRRPALEIAERLVPLQADLPGAIAGLVRMITFVDRRAEGVVDDLIRTMTSVDPAVAVPTMRALLEWDIEARWPLVPGIVRTINSSALLPLIAELPERDRLQVRLIGQVGHFPMMEDPEDFNAHLRRALDEVLAG